jgi:hypothetical protein
MPYLIKAVSTSGIVTWLTRPGTEGSRSIASRSRAHVHEDVPQLTSRDSSLIREKYTARRG